MPWSAVAGGVASAVVGSALSDGGSGGAAGAADPFASQRGRYQNQLSSFMSDPSSYMKSDPGYQFQLQQGLDQAKGAMASKGLVNSGNFYTGLINYAEGAAGTEYQNIFNNLALLSGATNGSPAAAGNILNSQNQQYQQVAASLGNVVSQNAGSWWNSLTGGGGGSATTASPETTFGSNIGMSYTPLSWGA